jgi:NAD(P)-dependent dehydrogenase (short-subunit alcohol dehydrogenase family)
MANTERNLNGKVVAITGGARGIGRATAVALIAAGAKVALGDIDTAQVSATAQELGRGTVGIRLDVTDRESFTAFLDQTEQQLGPLDVLINNAGIMPIGSFLDESDAVADRQIEINLKGVILGSKLAVERFRGRGSGQLVNVASTAGKFGTPGGATYSATKHAVVGLSEAIRREVRDLGIDVSIVMPLVVDTDLGSGLHDTRGLKVLAPEDVADAILAALRSGKVDVYVPRWVGVILRMQSVTPRPLVDLLVKAFGADDVLTAPDAVGRAAYNERIGAGPADARSSALGAEPVDQEEPLASQAAIR